MRALGGENESVKASFDRIALLPQPAWDHNSHHHNFLLNQLPAHAGLALDIGCGAGRFARSLAPRMTKVLAVDFSSEMIKQAREQSQNFPNIEFIEADFLTYPLAEESLDCAVSIATFHHLPFAETCRKLHAALKPGGILMVLDLYHPQTLSDHLSSLLAVPLNLALRMLKLGAIRELSEARAAWREHAQHDQLESLESLARICSGILPGARLRRHLLWRYSLIWRKPLGGTLEGK